VTDTAPTSTLDSLIHRLRPADETCHCPTDNWDFVPRYTDGVCPLCGYRPEGAPITAPWSARVDWFWPTAAMFLVISVVMGILVLAAYNR